MGMTLVGSDRLGEILDAARGVRVLVVGDVMLDRYLRGDVERISPEAPVPVLRVSDESTAVGGAANVAANVVALGASCGLVGAVGDDDGGRDLDAQLREMGVDTSGLVVLEDRPTTVKTRVMARRQQIVRVDREVETDITHDGAERVVEAIRVGMQEAGCLALQDYNKGLLVPEVIRAALDTAEESGVGSVVDPKRWRFFDYGGATVFKPNARELTEALGEPLAPYDTDWMTRVRDRLACDRLLLTLGEAGMALLDEEGQALHVPTVARSVYDVSGAGDTVTAAVAVGLAVGATAVEAAVLANYAAAVVVGKTGVQPAYADEVLAEARRYLD